MEKPILFSSEMVRAILDGRKTQTRRVIKPQPMFSNVAVNGMTLERQIADEKAWWIVYKCPYGRPGDTLWVRETWASHRYMDDTAPSEFTPGAQMLPIFYRANYGSALSGDCGKWRPSIHMPRWASRLTLRVVDVRVEELWEMSVSTMEAEGVAEIENDDKHPLTPFITLWNTINAKRGYSWDSNPWVWVVEFEVVK